MGQKLEGAKVKRNLKNLFSIIEPKFLGPSRKLQVTIFARVKFSSCFACFHCYIQFSFSDFLKKYPY